MNELLVNLDNLNKSGLSLTEYLILQLIYEDLELPDGMLLDEDIKDTIESLERDMYIKVLEDTIVVRQKGLDIFAKKNEKSIPFDDFWEDYHKISGLPKTDREAARKYWNSLRIKEKKLAFDKIQLYCDNNPRFRKKARTYLKDKNFNDEYTTTNQESDFTINA